MNFAPNPLVMLHPSAYWVWWGLTLIGALYGPITLSLMYAIFSAVHFHQLISFNLITNNQLLNHEKPVID